MLFADLKRELRQAKRIAENFERLLLCKQQGCTIQMKFYGIFLII